MSESKKILALIAELEQVIKENLESSEHIARLVEKIQKEGVQVSLNFIALFSNVKGQDLTPEQITDLKKPRKKRKLQFRITDDDREFLKDIGIRFD